MTDAEFPPQNRRMEFVAIECCRIAAALGVMVLHLWMALGSERASEWVDGALVGQGGHVVGGSVGDGRQCVRGAVVALHPGAARSVGFSPLWSRLRSDAGFERGVALGSADRDRAERWTGCRNGR